MGARLMWIVSVAAGAWIALVSNAPGQIVVVPPGLSPGASYRLVFVTSATRNGTSPNVADYKAFVMAAANSRPLLAGLGTTWTAITSTQMVDAQDNTGTNPMSVGGVPANPGVPFYRLDGARVAPNNATFWNAVFPESTISFTELGTRTPISLQTPAQGEQPWVWTGTTSGGTKSPSNSLGASFPVAAVAPNSGAGPYAWIGLATSAANDAHALYGMSGVLTVPSFQAADFEEDHDVDGMDLDRWRANMGLAIGAMHMQGDADGDGAVDGDDLLVWQQQLNVALVADPAATSVPEPSGICLALTCGASVAGLRRRSRLTRPRS